MKSKASVARHPIHPMLVPIPIGLWIFSLVCDILLHAKGDPIWSTLALYSMAGGIIGALLAAVPGLIDLLSMSPSPTKKIGIWHMVINLVVVVLYVGNFLLRVESTGPAGSGPFILSILAILLLVVSGWLGGELVYVHGVAVDPVNGKKGA